MRTFDFNECDNCLAVEPLHHEKLGQIVEPFSRILVRQCDPDNEFQKWTTTSMPDGVHMTICSLGKQTDHINNIICLYSDEINIKIEENGARKYDGKIVLRKIRKQDMVKADDRFQFRGTHN